MVSLRVSAGGCAAAVAIVGSSDSAMLDEAVMQFYETFDFTPAEIDAKPADGRVAGGTCVTNWAGKTQRRTSLDSIEQSSARRCCLYLCLRR
jgi:TonB family protein